MKTKYSVSSFWDRRVMNPKTNESRLMLSITINRVSFKVSIKMYCTEADYKKVFGRSLNEKQKKLRQELRDLILKSESLLERLTEPTKEPFLKFFKSDANLSNGSKVDAYALCKVKFDAFTKEGRFGPAMLLDVRGIHCVVLKRSCF